MEKPILYAQGDVLLVPIKSIPENVTKQESNQEVKRALIEHYGRVKFFKNSEFKVKHSDDFGDLCSVKTNYNDESVEYFVKVINGTENQDGSFDEYILQVPGDMDTAKEAVAWTYGLSEKAYDNILRT